MTEDERRMEDMMLGKHAGKDKAKIKFMQKYYHKGAFYMVRPRSTDGCTHRIGRSFFLLVWTFAAKVLCLVHSLPDVETFFQDEQSVEATDDVRRRNYHQPTLEDKFDKSQMPRVMQVRQCSARMLDIGALDGPMSCMHRSPPTSIGNVKIRATGRVFAHASR